MKKFGIRHKTAEERVKAAKFRLLNEDLYTKKTDISLELFSQNPELFDEYHKQFRAYTRKWAYNPVDLFIKSLENPDELSQQVFPLYSKSIIDVGCGDAKIAQMHAKLNIQSFDLVKRNDRITVADAVCLPLANESVDLAVYSLSLMGNPTAMLREASRVLKFGGCLWIAEVGSRCAADAFRMQLAKCGFSSYYCKDLNYFWIQGFIKKTNFGSGSIEMRPCKYKRR